MDPIATASSCGRLRVATTTLTAGRCAGACAASVGRADSTTVTPAPPVIGFRLPIGCYREFLDPCRPGTEGERSGDRNLGEGSPAAISAHFWSFIAVLIVTGRRA